MSKISYCSLEEAWGDSYKKTNDNSNNNNISNNTINTNNISNKIVEKIERDSVIKNINNIEKNNSITEYNKYRINPNNNVVENNYSKEYTPFNESIEKKYLQDKLNFLENEFRKYKDLFEENENKNDNINNIDNFSNQNIYETSNKKNDLIDLFLLIIIGLILIFVMNSIFTIGKSIGARNN